MKKAVVRKFGLAVIAALCLNISLDAVVIVVHGSFSAHKKWWKLSGDFFEELRKQLHYIDPKQIVTSFGWSGIPSSGEIEKAAKQLVEVIKRYPESEPIILIGHSHGGNVINKASQILALALQNPLDVTATTKAIVLDHVPPPGHLINKKYCIEKVFYLGTPVDKNRYAPNLNVIDHVVNLYSRGDSVQRVGGFYDRVYPTQDRLINMEVFFAKGKDKTKPGHFQLHDKTVGRWLLFIPELLASMKVNHFATFKYGSNGTITFDSQQAPILGL